MGRLLSLLIHATPSLLLGVGSLSILATLICLFPPGFVLPDCYFTVVVNCLRGSLFRWLSLFVCGERRDVVKVLFDFVLLPASVASASSLGAFRLAETPGADGWKGIVLLCRLGYPLFL